MRPNGNNPVLSIVIGASIGALIGLCLIKFTLLAIPGCAVAGGLIGFAIAASRRNSSGYYSDDGGIDVGDVASAGCLLADALSWLSCLGCGTAVGGLLTLLVFVIVRLVHRSG